MKTAHTYKKELFKITPLEFEKRALEAFAFQFNQNDVYRQYCLSLGKTPEEVIGLTDIPFLPIEFFKSHVITSTKKTPETIFLSSGTTSTQRSKHYIPDLTFYHQVARHSFEKLFGPLSERTIVALLPSYLENGDSSLISMVDHFMKHAAKGSRYMRSDEKKSLPAPTYPKILFGVSHALLDVETIQEPPDTLIIETGGMKGRKKEITREELHQEIMQKTNLGTLWSEYGMTELHSQAYGESGFFRFPEWARVFTRDMNDPFSYTSPNKSGGLNIIDLANIETCCFIETKDIGKINGDGTFQVLGRMDNSDVRGCNQLI